MDWDLLIYFLVPCICCFSGGLWVSNLRWRQIIKSQFEAINGYQEICGRYQELIQRFTKQE